MDRSFQNDPPYSSMLYIGGTPMIKKWFPAVVITFLMLCLIGIKVYSTHPEIFPSFSSKVTGKIDHQKSNIDIKEKSQNKISHVKHRDATLEDTFPFELPEFKELAKKYPDKFNIVKKMYYAWDYIHNAKGEYEYSYPMDGEKEHIRFFVDLDKKTSLATNEIYQGGNAIETENFLFKNGVAIHELPKMHLFARFSKPASESSSLAMYNGFITESEWYFILNHNYTNWHYKEGTAFGMPVYEIKGNIPSDISNNLAGPFTMTVSKDTGALLGLTIFNNRNKVKFYIKVKHIEINKGIPAKIFELDVSGDKEVTKEEYIKNTAGYVDKNKK